MMRTWLGISLFALAITACKGNDTAAPEPLGTAHDGRGAGPASPMQVEPSSGPPPTDAQGRAYDAAEDRADAIATDERPREFESKAPGLGTAYGESRQSSASTTPFEREHARRPDAVLVLWYDDPDSMRRAVDIHGGYYDGMAWMQSEDGMLSMALVDEWGQGLPGVQLDDKRYAVGQLGQRYMIALQNDGPERVEAVASVDGLDVIDGQTASYRHRGYIVEPYSTMMIDGWRTSLDSVAAFRFSAIEDSYAERKGKGRNIGVVGVAFFREKAPKFRSRPRRHADPFPGS